MVEKSKYCGYMMKNILTKNLYWLNKIKEILKTLGNAGFTIMIMLMVMLKKEIMVTSLENIEDMRIEIVISRLN